MTNLQKTIKTYKETSKSMAYLSFIADENSLRKSFEDFCKGMDSIIRNQAA